MKIERPSGISAEVVAHSVNEKGKEIATVCVTYGLYVHGEFLRHRQLSRCVKSNRAIPTKKIRSEVVSRPYVPVFFGKNKPGMQSTEEMSPRWLAEFLWKTARYPAIAAHWLIEKLGGHKEWANRLLNPWQFVTETITATEWENLYALRIHPAAQRDIQEIVTCIKEAIDMSREAGNVKLLRAGELHVPYVLTYRSPLDDFASYVDNDGKPLSIQQAIECSVARCARSSYNAQDGSNTTWEKDKPLYDRLLADTPKHASPAEHVAWPMSTKTNSFEPDDWQKGTTHVDQQGNLWSGNFCEWVQFRQTLDNHDLKG